LYITQNLSLYVLSRFLISNSKDTDIRAHGGIRTHNHKPFTFTSTYYSREGYIKMTGGGGARRICEGEKKHEYMSN
jgi:hypothetical protein